MFTFFENGKHISEDHPTALALMDQSGKNALDIGCVTCMLVRGIAAQDVARVNGLDLPIRRFRKQKKHRAPR